MNPEQLRYDQETATRYSDPPTILVFEIPNLELLDHYAELTKLRAAAKGLHRDLVTAGVFRSIPTLTSETRTDRPGTYWRAVFKINSPEVLAGLPRKHYIGSSPAKLHRWADWIARTQEALDLNQLIHDLGWRLKGHCDRIQRTSAQIAADCSNYKLRLEELTP